MGAAGKQGSIFIRDFLQQLVGVRHPVVELRLRGLADGCPEFNNPIVVSERFAQPRDLPALPLGNQAIVEQEHILLHPRDVLCRADFLPVVPQGVQGTDVPYHPDSHKRVPRPVLILHRSEIIESGVAVKSLSEETEAGQRRRVDPFRSRVQQVDLGIDPVQFRPFDGEKRRFFRRRPLQSEVRLDFLPDEMAEHDSIAVPRCLELCEGLTRRQFFGFQHVGIRGHRHPVPHEGANFFEVAVQQADHLFRQVDPIVQ